MAKSKYNIGDSVRVIRKNKDSVNAFGLTGTVIELAGDRPTTRPICVRPHNLYNENGIGTLWWKEKELMFESEECPDGKKAKAAKMSFEEEMDLMGPSLLLTKNRSCLLL